ncbi:MAG: twin-arginine translocation signal domain-containing protein [Candidatus Nanosalina sp.]
MSGDDTYLSESRRSFMKKMAGAGSVAAIAGCSGQDGNKDTNPTTSTTQETVAETTSVSQDTTTSTDGSTPEGSGQGFSESGDQQFEGEEEFESELSQGVLSYMEIEDLSENFTLSKDSTEYSSLARPLYFNGNFLDDGYATAMDGGQWRFNELYLMLLPMSETETEPDKDYQINIFGIASEPFEVGGKMRYENGVVNSRAEYSEQKTKSFFRDKVHGYTDVSEDFPDDLRELAQE